jgi:hypothetical protein
MDKGMSPLNGAEDRDSALLEDEPGGSLSSEERQ